MPADLPGKFEGVTIDAKLIGGQQYEKLYERIGDMGEGDRRQGNILSKKNHFELDKEIKSDIATGGLTWCVGSNHSPSLRSIRTSIGPFRPHPFRGSGKFVPGRNRRLDARRQARHAAAGAVRRLRSLFPEEPLRGRGEEDEFKAKYGYDLAPPDTWAQVSDQAEFFAAPPEFLRTSLRQEEAINGRFYEMLVAEGGNICDKDGRPAFNSEAGVRALEWFRQALQEQGGTAGHTNYLWDISDRASPRLDCGQSRWPGWHPSSTIRSRRRSPAMSASRFSRPALGKRTGWSGITASR